MSNYSYSRLDLYGNCPQAYKFRYLDKRQEIPSEALERGKEVHEVIAAYIRHCLETGCKTDVEFLRSYPGGTDEVREILGTYADTHIIEPGKYAIEEMWKLPIAGHTWWGVIDALKDEGKTIRISDAKTNYQISPQAEIDKNAQLRYYAWMAAQKHPQAETFVCSIDFVRHGVIREVTYELDDISAIEDRIIANIDRIEGDSEYKATPGAGCGWCSWSRDCPAVTDRGPEVLLSAQDAEELAGEKVALEARKKAIDTLLKPWCTKEGAVEVNGMAVGWHKTESVGYPDADKLSSTLSEGGYDALGYLRPDTKGLKAAAGKDEKLAALLDPIKTDKSYTRFEARKVR